MEVSFYNSESKGLQDTVVSHLYYLIEGVSTMDGIPALCLLLEHVGEHLVGGKLGTLRLLVDMQYEHLTAY